MTNALTEVAQCEAGPGDNHEANPLTLTLQPDDLESLPFVMAKVEAFLQQIGFNYLTIKRISEDHSGYGIAYLDSLKRPH